MKTLDEQDILDITAMRLYRSINNLPIEKAYIIAELLFYNGMINHTSITTSNVSSNKAFDSAIAKYSK